MSETGVAGLDHSIQETNIWLKSVCEKIHREERRQAYAALRAVLHTLRDRLTPEVAVHFGAQLPTFIRGLYYEGWHMADKPLKLRTLDDFAQHVATALPPNFGIDGLTVTRQVLEAISEHLGPEEPAKLASNMPPSLRTLWPAYTP